MSIAHRIRVRTTETLTDRFNRVDETTLDWLRSDGRWQTLKRETVNHGDGAAILLLDPRRRTVVLVRQLRWACVNNGLDDLLLEVPAGLLDDASPEDCIRAEAEQEVGFRVHRPRKVFDAFMSPGSLTERLHGFVAEVDAGDRIAPGGGLHDEGEDIEVVELPWAEAVALLRQGRLRDAKTIMLLQHAVLEGLIPRA